MDIQYGSGRYKQELVLDGGGHAPWIIVKQGRNIERKRNCNILILILIFFRRQATVEKGVACVTDVMVANGKMRRCVACMRSGCMYDLETVSYYKVTCGEEFK